MAGSPLRNNRIKLLSSRTIALSSDLCEDNRCEMTELNHESSITFKKNRYLTSAALLLGGFSGRLRYTQGSEFLCNGWVDAHCV